MTYQKNHLISHQQSNFKIFFAKTHIFYLLCSCTFWMIVIWISWFRFYDPKLGETLSIYKLDSLFFVFHLILYFIFIVGLCVLIGAILSLPAILASGILDYIVLLERKKYKRVFYLVFMAQYLPYVLLILTNGLFYYANTSSKIDNLFLHSRDFEKTRKNYEQIGQKNPDGYYVFLVPDYLLENAQKLPNTKSILSFNGDLFLESSSKTEITALLISQESNDIIQYYAPGFIRDEKTFEIPPTKLSIGIDRKNVPEFLNLYSKNIVETKRFRLTKSTLLSNRAMASLKPLHLVLKANVLGIVNANWRWENFGNSSLDILSKYSTRLKQNDSSQYNILFLSDLEKASAKSLFSGSSDFLNQNDRLQSEESLDKNLFIAIHSLLKTGAKNIVLLPYQTEAVNFKISHFFTTMPMTASLKSYRTFFQKNNADFFCKTQFIQNQNTEATFNQSILMDNLKFSKKGIPYLNSEYGPYIKRFFANALFCYEKNEKIYVLKRNSANNMTSNFPNNRLETNNLDIYRISNDNISALSVLLTKEEKNNLIYKYKYEIFK